MLTKLRVLAFGLVLLASPAFAGGGTEEPPPPENPPLKFSLYDQKNTELYCRLCDGECQPEPGKKEYSFKNVRKWHKYLCRKINLSAAGTRSYASDEN